MACVSCVCGYVLQVLHLFVFFSPRSYWHFALGRNSNLRLYSRSGKEKYSINHGIKNAQAKLTQACVTEYSCGCLEIARFCRRTLEHVRQKLPEDAEEAFASCEWAAHHPIIPDKSKYIVHGAMPPNTWIMWVNYIRFGLRC